MGHSIRMRGFRSRSEVTDVIDILDTASPLASELVTVSECAGRNLTQEVVAPINVPGFVRAAVDGYAIRGEDSFGASEQNPLLLQVLGTSLPGRPFAGSVGHQQAVRITTGAPVPEGADAVIQAELTQLPAGQRLEQPNQVELVGSVAPQKHMGQVGEDVSRGETILRPPRRLRPQDAGVLASLSIAEVPVVRRPRVQMLVTGSELVAPGNRPGPHQIVDSNSVLLAGLVARDRGRWLPPIRVADGEQSLTRGLDQLISGQADILLVSGATSVGLEDLMPTVLATRGKLLIHGVAMRPASPTGLGQLHDGRFVLLLPGNPVSCLCAYEFFVGPLVRRLEGHPQPWRWPHPQRRLQLARKIVSKIGRVDFVRVGIAEHEGGDQVVPIATSGASNLSSAVRAAGVVVVERDLEGLAPETWVNVHLFDDPTETGP